VLETGKFKQQIFYLNNKLIPLNTEQINMDGTYEIILLARREGNYKKCYELRGSFNLFIMKPM
jgi:hypothetical protein